jgi:hypothetical protein
MPSKIHSPARSVDAPRFASCACARSATKCSSCADSLLGPTQARSTDHAGHGPESAPVVADTLGRRGEPLDRGVRAVMESRFGHDFSRVRVHADGGAALAALFFPDVPLVLMLSPRNRPGDDGNNRRQENAQAISSPGAGAASGDGGVEASATRSP